MRALAEVHKDDVTKIVNDIILSDNCVFSVPYLIFRTKSEKKQGKIYYYRERESEDQGRRGCDPPETSAAPDA